MLKINKEKKINYLYVILFIGITLFLFWKSHLGFAKKDELFYLQIPYRLYQGDALMVDEKNLGQLFGALMYPLLKLYLSIFKTLDGIMLSFRYIYIFFQGLTSVILYKRLKGFNQLGALIGSLAFYMYAPYNLMALSYNSLCFITLALTFTILLTKKNNFEYFVVGILIAFSVLCNPYILAIYVLYAVAVIVFNVLKKKDILDKYDVLKIKSFFTITLGATTIAVIFFAFLLSRTSVHEVIDYVSTLQLTDTEHPKRSFFEIVSSYIIYIFTWTKLSGVLYGAELIAFVLYFFDKNKAKNYDYYLCFIICVCGLQLVDYLIFNKLINYIIFPLNIVSLFILLTNKNDTNNKILFCFYIPSMLYTLVNHMASNMEFKTITSSACVCLIISIVVLVDLIQKKKIINKKVYVLGIILMLTFISIEGFERYIWVFSARNINNQKYLIEKGPYKGLVVDEYSHQDYMNDIDVVEYIRNNLKCEKVAFLGKDIWMYFIADEMECSSPSVWETMYVTGIPMMNRYYEENPEKIPDVFYASEEIVEHMKQIDIIDKYEHIIILGNRSIYIKKSF